MCINHSNIVLTHAAGKGKPEVVIAFSDYWVRVLDPDI